MLPLWVHTVQGSTHSTPTAFQIEKKPYAQSFGKFPIRCFILSIGERKKRHTNISYAEVVRVFFVGDDDCGRQFTERHSLQKNITRIIQRYKYYTERRNMHVCCGFQPPPSPTTTIPEVLGVGNRYLAFNASCLLSNASIRAVRSALITLISLSSSSSPLI